MVMCEKVDFCDIEGCFLGGWVETMKEAMSIVTPINCGPPREPLTRLSSRQIKQMEVELKAAAL